MTRPALALVPAALAACLLLASGLSAQQEPAPAAPAARPEEAPAAVGRYQALQTGKRLTLLDTATGRVYQVEDADDADAHTIVVDPVAGHARIEALRFPQRERLARAAAQALLAGDRDGLLGLLPSKRQRQVAKDQDAAKKFQERFAELAAELPKDVDAAARFLLLHEGDDIEYSEPERRWLIKW